MRFSIIIPAHNSEKYLALCLGSLEVQARDFRGGFEAIVVDDGSADGSAALAEGFAGRLPHFRVVRRERAGGPGIARNAGLDLARGEWVLFLDSDDELLPGALAALDAFLAADAASGAAPQLGAVGYDWTAEEADPGLNSSKRVGRRDGQYLADRETLLRHYLSLRMDGSVIYTAFRRDVLDRAGVRFGPGLHEDVDYAFKAFYHAPRAAYFDKVLYKKRNRSGSIINGISAAHVTGFFRAWREVGAAVAALPPGTPGKEEYLACFRHGSIGTIATRVREVVRHMADAAAMAPLFALIHREAFTLFDEATFREQITRSRTTYYAIADLLMKTMGLPSLNERERAEVIAREVGGMSGKSWSCGDLHHALFLRSDQVRACAKRFFVDGEMKGDVVLYKIEPGEADPISYEAVLKSKQGLHQKLNSGEPTDCDGCPFLEFREWPALNELDIRALSFEHHSVCNLKCTYCSEEYYGGKKPLYDVKSTIENLLHRGALEHCSIAVWAGGEPVIGSDFESLLGTLAAEIPEAQQRVLTNAVKRSPKLEELLAANRAQIVTSIDAGTEETFKTIRGRAQMRAVFENLRAYSKLNADRVTVKYIFTDGNDSLDEVRGFCALVQEYGLTACPFQISTDFKHETIPMEAAVSMMVMFGLLQKAGCATLYFDELLRHRLGQIIDLGDAEKIASIHALVGREFIATPAKYPSLAIWGAGQQARYLMESTAFFRKTDVAFFVDATPEKIGTRFFDKEVRDPSALRDSDLPVVIAAVQGYPLILEQYRNLGLPDSRVVRDLII